MPINGTLPVPSTAATTPRLGLMNPVDADLFKASDYADTFQILDAVPGTYPVANSTARQALTWGANQHGSRVLQLDNGSEWYWYWNGSSGSWKRVNSVGLMQFVQQTSPVSTVSTSDTTFIQTPTFTAPGVRALRVDLRVGVDNSNGLDGIVKITLADNNVSIYFWNIRAGSFIGSNGTGGLISCFIQNPSVDQSHQISARVACIAVSQASGGYGTSTVRNSVLTVTEV